MILFEYENRQAFTDIFKVMYKKSPDFCAIS